MGTRNFSTVMCLICTILWIVTGISQVRNGNSQAVLSFALAAVCGCAAFLVWRFYDKRR